MNSQIAFQKLVTNKIKFGLFMFYKLPSAFICGVRPKSLSESTAEVTIPFKWLSQNPFKSMYFACQAMAAELSTGLLALMYLHKLEPGVSMLVIKMEAQYFKKAKEKITFICNDGLLVKKAITDTLETNKGTTCTLISKGYNSNNEIVSEFAITWSFKAK